MCTGVEIAVIGAALGGTALQMKSADDAADNQKKIIRNAALETESKNKQKEALVQNFAADTFDPAARDQRYETAATEREGSLVDALTAANGGKEGEINATSEGNISDEYTRRKAESTSLATKDILNRARLMARNSAGGLLYNQEQLDTGQLRSDVAGINSSIQRANGATNLALQNAQDRGSLVGGLLQAGAPGIGMLGKKAA